MERKTAADFDQELLILFDAYVHGDIDRRGFLDRASKFAVGGMTAVMLLEALNPKFAEAQVIPKDDARLTTEFVFYPSPQGYSMTRGYLVKPKAATGKLPGILVVHENRGLNPHIEDIARRLALENYLVFAPDALAPLGGYPGDEDKARTTFATLEQPKTREDMIAAVRFLKTQPGCTGKVGAVGFCYGGGIAHMLATKVPDLAAAVPFYGNTPPVEAAAAIKAPLLVHLAEKDERITGGWPVYEAALKAANVKYTAHIYPGAQHGFNNDTTPRYDEASAKLAWSRTLEFFAANLRG
ncbi:Carboxymethylenebutenolidase [Luteitalea pratensis]|uniref:Carboxymethylenebutenolidase n=1 Tax=Luteitalea pratensis TaxID=1855912 RepID=A0A143PJT1_LUTPR|nr:dienelactone hydrolase family protein [Luteitalea pratensis]AMY08751.1 Carboxymethylenebutenolidase [Luteitalea pratensis]